MAVPEVFEYIWIPIAGRFFLVTLRQFNGNGKMASLEYQSYFIPCQHILQSYFLIGGKGWQSLAYLFSSSSVNSGELFVHGGEL